VYILTSLHSLIKGIFGLHTHEFWEMEVPSGMQGRSLGIWGTQYPEASGLLHNKNHLSDIKNAH